MGGANLKGLKKKTILLIINLMNFKQFSGKLFLFNIYHNFFIDCFPKIRFKQVCGILKNMLPENLN